MRWWVPPLAGALLCLPGMWLPFMLDDWFHLSALDAWLGDGQRLPPFFAHFRDAWGSPNVFSFFHGATTPFIEAGVTPWWMEPTLSIRFLRPLSTLTHLVDHQLFGTWAVGAHVHSMLWYLTCIVVVGMLLREVLDERLAWLSTMLFALDDGHWYAALWIANRNALVAVVPALLGLVAHIRWQRGWRPGLPLSVLGLGVGLAGGEPALGVFALLLAYQLWGDARHRLAGLVPSLAIGVVWAAIYKGFDYGAHGSGMYLDPIADPAGYILAGLWRAPMLVAGQVLSLPVDVAVLFPELRAPAVVLGLAASGLLVWAARRGPPAVRWLAAGGALALLPVVATAPINRLLVVASIGMFPALAVLLDQGWREKRWGLVALLGVPHVLVSSLGWLVTTGGSLLIAERYAQVDWDVLGDGDVVMVGVADPGVGVYMPIERAYLGKGRPRTGVYPDFTPSDHRVTRTDETTLRVEILDGRIGPHPFEMLFRNFDAAPLEVGHEQANGAVVMRAAGGDAQGIHTVDVTLDFEQVDVAIWTAEGFEVIDLAVGEVRDVPYARGPIGL